MTEAKFWTLIDKTTTCWVWRGPKDSRGYGRIYGRYEGRSIRLAHRYAFMLWYGFDPIDLHHTCRNSSCVSPFHLSPLGRAANARIQTWPERDAQGHEFDTFYVNRKGYRIRLCSICNRESRRRHSQEPEVREYRSEWARQKRIRQLAAV